MPPELSEYKLVLKGDTTQEQWNYLQNYKTGQRSRQRAPLCLLSLPRLYLPACTSLPVSPSFHLSTTEGHSSKDMASCQV